MMLGDLLHSTRRDVESLGDMFDREVAASISLRYGCVPHMISMSRELHSLFTLLYCAFMTRSEATLVLDVVKRILCDIDLELVSRG